MTVVLDLTSSELGKWEIYTWLFSNVARRPETTLIQFKSTSWHYYILEMPSKKNLLEHFDDGTLDLSLSDIQEVPVRDIAGIPKATTLDLSSNRIVTIPKNFPSSLTHLVKLDLCQNQLTELPDNFGLLVHLKHLDLYSNKLTSLPLSFGNLKALRWLDLKQNPLMPKLAQIAGPCLDAPQCQACAKNVVAMLNTMQSQVEAERVRRQEQRQKQQEINELKAQTEKTEQQQQQKKKKKKSAEHAENKMELKENGTAKGDSENKTEEKKDIAKKIKPDPKKTKSLGGKIASFLSFLLKIIVITSLAVIFIMFLLSLLDDDTYRYAQNKLNFGMHFIRQRLPVPMVKKLDIYSTYIKNLNVVVLKRFQSFSVTMFERLQEAYVNVLSNKIYEQYFQSIQDGWLFVWIKVSELYRTALSLVI